MKSFLLGLIFVFSFNLLQSQVVYKHYDSYKLGETRELKIQLPRGYDENDKKSYPLFVVLDGDYMFEAIAGNVDYFSYWEDMPDAIVVGVNQEEMRYDDSMYSGQNSLPIETGAAFFEFIGVELIPYIENTYKVGNFKVAVGHGETANFINYYLLKPQPVFQGYMVISPELAPQMSTYLSERLAKIDSKVFYHLATSNNDIASIRQGTEELNTMLKSIENSNFFYYFDQFDEATHYTLPTHAIPNALEDIFSVFRPISKEEYKKVILELETSPVVYLEEKYQTIKELFGIDKEILINDFKAIDAAIEKKENYQYFEALGKLARDQYPDTLLGNYYLGRFYEENGEPKKAMRTYQSGYSFAEIAGITKDLLLERADAIKADFGY